MSNGLAKNWEVVRAEWDDYRMQVAVVRARVRRTASWRRKLHHLSGLGPDIHRLMPRTLWYSSGLLVMVVVGCVAWRVWG